jgi:hypothetical protein
MGPPTIIVEIDQTRTNVLVKPDKGLKNPLHEKKHQILG